MMDEATFRVHEENARLREEVARLLARNVADDALLYELHMAALVVSTDLAQDALEDPIGNHEREKDGWRRLSVAAATRLANALRALPQFPGAEARPR
jgi:hypothetical protein